jgi:hypothetical protein
MGDVCPTVKVACVQAASVFLDREASVAKACRLIRERGTLVRTKQPGSRRGDVNPCLCASDKLISPSPVTLVEGARWAQRCPPGTIDNLGTPKAKVLHQVNQFVAESEASCRQRKGGPRRKVIPKANAAFSPPMSQLKLATQQGRRRLLDGGNCARYALQAPDRRRVALFSSEFNIRCDDFAGVRSMFTDHSRCLTISVGELF